MTRNKQKLKVLNLYAGIGENRKLWKGVDVTAIEYKPEIAEIYKDNFPDDKVIVGDAVDYLLKHWDDGWDFVWASPPCPSHSSIRYVGAKTKSYDPELPDLSLYSIIIFMNHYLKCKWVVENVKPYYQPLDFGIKPQESGRHYFWSNFPISNIKSKASSHSGSIEDMQKHKGFDISKYKLSGYKGRRRDQILRNCVESELGLHIFKMAFNDKQKTLV